MSKHQHAQDLELTPAEAFDEQRRDYGDAFRVSRPHHGEGATVWYVLDPEGEPVDAAFSRDEAQRIRDAIAASYREPIPE